MVEKVKEIRVNIETLIQVADELGDYNDDVKNGIRALRLSKMWLGKALGEMGLETPYKNGDDVTSQKIDPKSDVAVLLDDEVWGDIDMMNQISIAKTLRSEIEKQLHALGDIFGFNVVVHDLGAFVNYSRMHMSEAKMWLGEFLNAIKVRNDKDEAANRAGAKEAYEAYVESLRPNTAPGTKFDEWGELSQFQQTGWQSVFEFLSKGIH
jgi:hypothetical protein